MISNILERFSNQRIVDTGNGWTFGLLGLLGLIAIPIVILIYLIKSKYVPKTVSSTFIWKRSLKYMKRRIPINFLMSLLLIVQLLAVTVATFALMDVRVEDEYQNNDKIIVIDASASMTLEREAIITTSSGARKEAMATRYQYALNTSSSKCNAYAIRRSAFCKKSLSAPSGVVLPTSSLSRQAATQIPQLSSPLVKASKEAYTLVKLSMRGEAKNYSFTPKE